MLKAINWIGCLFLSLSSFAQLNQFTFEEVDSLNKLRSKPIVVFLHTNWCSYCEAMMQTTFKDEELIQTLNDHFYYIPFDAESENDVVFQSHTFTFQPNGNKQGVHQLAIELGKFNGGLSYPTTCILNQDHEIIFQYNELMTKDHLLLVLQDLIQSK